MHENTYLSVKGFKYSYIIPSAQDAVWGCRIPCTGKWAPHGCCGYQSRGPKQPITSEVLHPVCHGQEWTGLCRAAQHWPVSCGLQSRFVVDWLPVSCKHARIFKCQIGHSIKNVATFDQIVHLKQSNMPPLVYSVISKLRTKTHNFWPILTINMFINNIDDKWPLS